MTTQDARMPMARIRRNESTRGREFEATFLEQWPRIYGVLRRLVGDRDEAQDLALEAFWRLYSRGGAEPELNPGGWLYRVATNLGLNALRARARRDRHELEAGRLEWSRGQVDPAEAASGEENRAQVRQVLSELAPQQAQLLVLRHSGLAYKEIAEALGLAPGSIGPLLVRAERDFERRYRQRYGSE